MHKDIRKALLEMGLPAINGEVTIGMTVMKEDTFCADLAQKLEGIGYNVNLYCENDCSSDVEQIKNQLSDIQADIKAWEEKHGG